MREKKEEVCRKKGIVKIERDQLLDYGRVNPAKRRLTKKVPRMSKKDGKKKINGVQGEKPREQNRGSCREGK